MKASLCFHQLFHHVHTIAFQIPPLTPFPRTGHLHHYAKREKEGICMDMRGVRIRDVKGGLLALTPLIILYTPNCNCKLSLPLLNTLLFIAYYSQGTSWDTQSTVTVSGFSEYSLLCFVQIIRPIFCIYPVPKTRETIKMLFKI